MSEWDITYLYPSAHDPKKTSKTLQGVLKCLLHHQLQSILNFKIYG